jgi:photosystem II stability/assembly factor-like uncharacterized protein
MRAPFWVSVALASSPLWAGWNPVGPFGGPAAIIQADRHHHGRVLAATSNAQLFRSDDDGGSWKPLPFPAELRSTLHSLIVDPHNPGVIFVGLASDNPEFSGVFRTTDNGTTWKHIPGLKKDVWALALWRDSRLMAAGTIDGVFLSRDAGDSWEHAGSPDQPEPQPVVSLAFDQVDPKIIYAGTPHLPWKTTDSGGSWHSIHEGMLDDSDVFSILIDSWHRQTLFVSVCGGMYRSLDSGEKWKALTKAKGASSRTYHITQNPLKPNIMLAGTTFGLVKSVDNGTTWRKLSDLPTRYIAFDPVKPTRIFVATESGLFRSDDLGETLEAINRGFTNQRITSLAASGNTLYVTTQEPGGSSVLRLGASRWESIPTVDPLLERKVLKVVSAGARLLYLVTPDNLLVSSDSGETWNQVPPPSTESPLKDLLLATLDGKTLLVAAQDGIYRTENTGATWKTISAEIIGLVATEDHGLLAATAHGLVRSDDAGATWHPVPGVLGSSTVSAICKHPSRPGEIYASQFGAVFASRDDGKSWKRLTPGDESEEAFRALLVLPGKPDRLFGLTQSRGVYATPLTLE